MTTNEGSHLFYSCLPKRKSQQRRNFRGGHRRDQRPGRCLVQPWISYRALAALDSELILNLLESVFTTESLAQQSRNQRPEDSSLAKPPRSPRNLLLGEAVDCARVTSFVFELRIPYREQSLSAARNAALAHGENPFWRMAVSDGLNVLFNGMGSYLSIPVWRSDTCIT